MPKSKTLLMILPHPDDESFAAGGTLAKYAALGACILTNVNAIGEKIRLQIDEARMEFDAARRDEPSALAEIRYQLILKSPEPPAKLAELHDLCVKWGTVINTLINGLTPQGELVIEKTDREGCAGTSFHGEEEIQMMCRCSRRMQFMCCGSPAGHGPGRKRSPPGNKIV